MTIDEAIAHAREVASRKFDDRVHCISCAEEHEQLADWLEELKAYREIGTVEEYKSAIECYTKEYLLRRNLQDQIKEQYNKAIYDALSVVEWDGYTIDIKERIEQLKKI